MSDNKILSHLDNNKIYKTADKLWVVTQKFNNGGKYYGTGKYVCRKVTAWLTVRWSGKKTKCVCET